MNFKILYTPKPIPLPQFGGSALGHKFAVTNQYITKDGKPYVYRMGEMHFSRIDERDWETELRKMKEGGIDIVASYLFWIHHEEVEGEFNFSGNRNLKKFCEICRRVGMPMFLRMGPWAHGEARNGGFPDWLLEKCGGKEHTRCNEKPYLDYAKRFYARVYEQVEDCMDTFVGIQIENELHRNPQHMEEMRKYADSLGFHAPIWTATGWGPAGSGVHLPNNSVIPVYGGYPEAPWTQHLEPLEESVSYLFSPDWDQCGDIGTDIFDGTESDVEEEPKAKASSYPYLTCELGGGIQVSYHRRPLIRSVDISAIVITRLGSGCNGLGYYMYHGGKNPIGKHTRMMQECRVTGYKNDYASVSYDFQAPLGDCGQMRQSYFDLQAIHKFLSVSGEKLATMQAFFPTDIPEDPFDKDTLRCAVRSDGNSGFLFFNNYSRLYKMKELQTAVCIDLPNASRVKIPLKVAPDAVGIIPFRFAIGSETVEWISAMP
ncbi:MAG: beta-galactosidase, partial [Clostridia bacterium]|nr:beta-galactosidase [Clostridia bacterium]